MASKPGWWFNVVSLKDKYTHTTTTTKHGQHDRYFIRGKGRVTEGQYISEYKGDLYQNQVRGYARANGITNWNQAQKQFTERRNEYMARVKAKEKELRKRTGDKDAKLDKQQRDELWGKLADYPE